MRKTGSICLFVFALLIAGNAMAKFTYEGHLTDLSDNSLTNQAATVKISVVGPASACVLLMESHAVLTDNNGFFSVEVGGGTDLDGLANTLDGVFSNAAVLSGMASCTYTPVAGDGRRLKIDVDIGSGFEALGYVAIGKSPQAAHADAVGGYSATNFVRTAGAAPLLSSADVTSLSQLIAGTSTLYAGPGANGTVTSVTGTSPIAVTTGTTTPVISIAQASASASGFLASADWTFFNNKLSASSNFSGDLSGSIAAPSVVKIRGFPVSTASPVSGDVLKYNGSQYVPTSLATALSNSLPEGQAFIGNVSNVAQARNIWLGDIRSQITPANPIFNISGNCATGTMITYTSATDLFTCEAFNLTNAQVASVGPLRLALGTVTTPTYGFSADSSTGFYSPASGELGFTALGIDIIRVLSTGQVGIGTIAPDSQLSVFGAMRATSISSSHSDTSLSGVIDFAQGNLVTSTYSCASNVSLSNIRDGGVYKIVMKDPGTTQCVFEPVVNGFDTGTLTFKFSPANGARTAFSDTVYELSRFGNTVYVKWATF